MVRSCGLEPEVSVFALQMMRLFYDGYCFSHYHNRVDNELVYNPTLALYFRAKEVDLFGDSTISAIATRH